MNNKCIYVLSALTALASGCSTEPSRIFNSFDLQKDVSISTGSRQRVITNTTVGSDSIPGQVNPFRVVCAEPSPDVATALANSFGAGVSILGKGDASLSGSSAEGIIQLAERTVTVQLLRDQMYRACEAFSNGAISGTTYSLVMSGINDTMVTLLLGETAGGAFGRKLGSIGSNSDSEARAALKDLEGGIEKTQEAAAELTKADKEVEDQRKIYDAKKALAEGKAADSDEAKAADEEKKKLDDLKKHRNSVAELLSTSASTMASAAATVEASVDGSISHKPDEKTALVLAGMQSSFLETDNTKSFVAACLVEMGRSHAIARKNVVGLYELRELEDITEPELRSQAQSILSRRELTQTAESDKERAFFVVLQNHWERLQEAASFSDSSAQSQVRADDALATVISYDRRRKPTALTTYCDQNLEFFVREQGENRTEVKKELELARIEVDKLEKEAKLLVQHNKLIETCGKADESGKKHCEQVYRKFNLDD